LTLEFKLNLQILSAPPHLEAVGLHPVAAVPQAQVLVLLLAHQLLALQ
jgi:hypothetical protein